MNSIEDRLSSIEIKNELQLNNIDKFIQENNNDHKNIYALLSDIQIQGYESYILLSNHMQHHEKLEKRLWQLFMTVLPIFITFILTFIYFK